MASRRAPGRAPPRGPRQLVRFAGPELAGHQERPRVRAARRQPAGERCPGRDLRNRRLAASAAWCPDPVLPPRAGFLGPAGCLAHGLRFRAGNLASAFGQAVRVLRRGRPGRGRHDAVARHAPAGRPAPARRTGGPSCVITRGWLACSTERACQTTAGRWSGPREIDGVPVQVVELTGSPGDVVVTHLHVFHTRSPNTSTVPRLMLGKEIRRAGEA